MTPPADAPKPAVAAAGWIEATGLGPWAWGGMSTRLGGVSAPPFDSLNLRPAGLPGPPADAPAAVAENERRLVAILGDSPVWLEQVHGARCVRLGADGRVIDGEGEAGASGLARADASFTTERGVVCAVLVADCLPVLFCVDGGRAVAAAHAGWRGLAAGVLERTVDALQRATGCAPGEIRAWMGACIGPQAFEVGAEVLEAFGVDSERAIGYSQDSAGAGGTAGQAADAFRFAPRPDGSPRWRADLGLLARQRLRSLGLPDAAIRAPAGCTFSEASRFFSYRRDGLTGRMAACIRLSGPAGR